MAVTVCELDGPGRGAWLACGASRSATRRWHPSTARSWNRRFRLLAQEKPQASVGARAVSSNWLRVEKFSSDLLTS